MESGSNVCKGCGKGIGVFEREKNEHMCKECFIGLVQKRVLRL